MDESIDRDLADVADHMEHGLDELVDAILVRVAALPGYSTGRRPGDTEDIRAGFRDSTRLFLACLRHDRAPTSHELERIALIGTQRARQGLPRESVSESLDHAQRVGFDFVLDGVRVVGSEPGRHEVTERAWARLSDFMTNVRAALLGGYDDAQGEPFTGPRREAALFVERLLGRRWTSEAEIRSHASSAGVTLGRSSALLLVVPAGKHSHEVLQEAVDRLVATLASAIQGAARWSPLLYVPVFIGSVNERTWERDRQEVRRLCSETGVSIASIGPRRSLTELAEGFTRIEAKLHHIPGARASTAFFDARELEVLHVLTGEATLTERIAFVRRVLGPVLLDDQAEELLAVIDGVYTTNGSAENVARAVHMGKSMVQRRLRAIAQITGLHLHVTSERFELMTARRLHLLLANELQSVDRQTFAVE